MEDILSTLRAVNVDPELFLRSAMVLSVGSLVLGTIGRFAFGKRSGFSHSVSSTFSILFVYAVAIVVYSAFPQLMEFIPSLPFVTFEGSTLTLLQFSGTHYTVLCSQLLDMIILAFLANLLDSLIPQVKNFFLWLLAKCGAVVGALALQLLVNWLLAKFLPAGLMTYAPMILLGLLVVMLLVGALKVVVGAVLSTVNPLIGAFYTFFFATVVGKALSKAMLTTLMLVGIVAALSYVGCVVISIATAALIAYIPLVILLVALWYVCNRIF